MLTDSPTDHKYRDRVPTRSSSAQLPRGSNSRARPAAVPGVSWTATGRPDATVEVVSTRRSRGAETAEARLKHVAARTLGLARVHREKKIRRPSFVAMWLDLFDTLGIFLFTHRKWNTFDGSTGTKREIMCFGHMLL